MVQNLEKTTKSSEPTDKEALDAVNLIYEWSLSSEKCTKEDVQTIYRLRRKIIDKICDDLLAKPKVY